jgi:transposase
MPGRSKITVREDDRAELRALARSAHRGEADRARAILMTLDGRKAADIAAALGAHVSTVRGWRGRFARGGAAALRRRRPPGRRAEVGPRAAAIAEALLGADADHDGPGWTLPRLCAEIRTRGGPAISSTWLARQLKKRGLPGAGRATRAKSGRTPPPSPPAAGASPS